MEARSTGSGVSVTLFLTDMRCEFGIIYQTKGGDTAAHSENKISLYYLSRNVSEL